MKKGAYTQRLHTMRQSKDFLIASHRGSVGINIPDNTLQSFDIALHDGADIIEMDVAMTTDGELVVFHDTMEPRLLHTQKNVQQMSLEELMTYELYNLNNVSTGIKVLRLSEAFAHLKNRCMINLDRCFAHPDAEGEKWERIFALVKKMDMADQILFKSPDDDKYVDFFERQSTPWMFMPMITRMEQVEKFIDGNINTVAVEVKFHTEDSPLADEMFYKKLQNNGCYVWGNALDLGKQYQLSAGHDDTAALGGNPDFGWGWFARKGFDIVQSDWILAMVTYYVQQGYHVK